MSATVTDPLDLARTYQTFARLLDYPDEAAWRMVGEALATASASSGQADALTVLASRSQEEREADYLAVFELGGASPYEGLCLHQEGRYGILEELLRFYHHFGLALDAEHRDFPDHLVTELEFMAYLLILEHEAQVNGRDSADLRRGQRDFLGRHLCKWIPALREKLARHAPSSAYPALVDCLDEFASAHLVELSSESTENEKTSVQCSSRNLPLSEGARP
jgi:DMSO reductase family type II enzyme chaperone